MRAARHRRLLDAIQVDAWPAGPLRRARGVGRRLRARRRVRPAAARRQRVGAPGRRRDRARRPQPARGAARRRPRRRADPARERQLRPRGRRPAARRHRAARDHAARRARASRSTGRVLSWQRWQVHVGFTPREGLVLQPLGYDDGGRLRSILYRASLSEMVVPYGDPSPTPLLQERLRRAARTASASPPRRSRSAATASARSSTSTPTSPTPPASRCTIPNAICIHEEDAGVLWRHIEWRDGSRRGAPLAAARDLLVLGDRQLRLRLLLVPATRTARSPTRSSSPACSRPARVAPGERPAHGMLVAPGLNAMVHQHFFNMRLDLDVDGLGERRRRGLDGVAAARPRQPARQRVQPAPAAASPPSSRPGAASTPPRRAGGRSSTRRVLHRLGEPVAYRLVPGENDVRRSPSPTRRCSRRAGVHPTSTSGSRRTTPASATPPASTRTCTPAARACPSGRAPTAPIDGERHRRLVHVRPPPRPAARGLADDAGGDGRLPAQAGRLLRAQPVARRAAARSRIPTTANRGSST